MVADLVTPFVTIISCGKQERKLDDGKQGISTKYAKGGQSTNKLVIKKVEPKKPEVKKCQKN